MSDTSSPSATIESYVACCRIGDAAGLQRLFHPQACMFGNLNGQGVAGTPELFFETVTNAPSPEQSKEDYQYQVELIQKNQYTAVVLLCENNYLGMNFKNSFQLMREQGDWLIVAKLFETC